MKYAIVQEISSRKYLKGFSNTILNIQEEDSVGNLFTHTIYF